MEVTVQTIQGITFAGLGESGHWVILDTEKKYGGSEGGAKPMELVLMGLGGCSGMEILSILKKMRIHVADLKIHIQAEQADEHPKVFKKVDVEYIVKGNQEDSVKIEKAVQLSHEKYCSVIAMLKKEAQINYSYKIEPLSE